jgi:hypothetical protein
MFTVLFQTQRGVSDFIVGETMAEFMLINMSNVVL